MKWHDGTGRIGTLLAMNTLLQSMLETTKHPPQMHSILVHFPVAVSALGLILLFALLVTRARSGGMRWACVLVYALGAGAAYFAFLTGEQAASMASTTVGDEAQALLQKHQEMGEKVWIFLAVTAAFTAFTAFRMPAVRGTMAFLALVAALSSAAWVGVTGHYGGVLVYHFGVGIGAEGNGAVETKTKVEKATVVEQKVVTSTAPAPRVTTMPAATEPAVKDVTKPTTTRPVTMP